MGETGTTQPSNYDYSEDIIYQAIQLVSNAVTNTNVSQPLPDQVSQFQFDLRFSEKTDYQVENYQVKIEITTNIQFSDIKQKPMKIVTTLLHLFKLKNFATYLGTEAAPIPMVNTLKMTLVAMAYSASTGFLVHLYYGTPGEVCLLPAMATSNLLKSEVKTDWIKTK